VNWLRADWIKCWIKCRRRCMGPCEELCASRDGAVQADAALSWVEGRMELRLPMDTAQLRPPTKAQQTRAQSGATNKGAVLMRGAQ